MSKISVKFVARYSHFVLNEACQESKRNKVFFRNISHTISVLGLIKFVRPVQVSELAESRISLFTRLSSWMDNTCVAQNPST